MIVAVLDWICFTGVNTHLAAFVQNNATIVGPLGIYFFSRLRARAELTPEMWDDEVVAKIGKRLGMWE